MKDQRLIDRLNEQISFIKTSCDLFDKGEMSEAKRIGTSIRMLIHETKQWSTPLLRQCGAMQTKLMTTFPAIPVEAPETRSSFWDSSYTISLSGVSVDVSVPPDPIFVPVDKWWNQIVYRLLDANHDNSISRKGVVLHTVDTDGGAHVDPKIDAALEMLISDGSQMSWIMGRPNERRSPLSNKHLVMLRRFGHELLHSPDLLDLPNNLCKRSRPYYRMP